MVVNYEESNQLELTDKQAWFFYLLIFPFIIITAFLNHIALTTYMVLLFGAGIILTIMGKWYDTTKTNTRRNK